MKNLHQQQGFTLIEIMVSLALFAVVAVVGVGAFLKIIDADRRAEAIESAVNDTNFALESMIRDIRVGTDYTCIQGGGVPPAITPPSTTDCQGSGITLAFNSSIPGAPTTQYPSGCQLIHAYKLSNTAGGYLEKAEQQTCGGPVDSLFYPLTSLSSHLSITSFNTDVTNTNNIGPIQPKVFMTITGTAGAAGEDQTSFQVQTSASQRLME